MAIVATGGTASLGWRLMLPDVQTMLLARPGPTAARAICRRLAALPPGTAVVLVDDLPGSRRRTRRLAARAGVTVEREYAVLPRLASAVLVVEDTPATVSWATRTLLAVPPGTTRLAGPLDLAVRVLRRWAPPWLLGALAPGRVLLGRRT